MWWWWWSWSWSWRVVLIAAICWGIGGEVVEKWEFCVENGARGGPDEVLSLNCCVAPMK
jgi:hypothetical protein